MDQFVSSRDRAESMLIHAWAWTSPVRGYMWRWYRYVYKEPLTDADQAHKSLKELCGYKLSFSVPCKIVSIRPLFKRFRFGLLVVVEPVQSKGKWLVRWFKWIQDPVELWLLRSALQKVPTPIQRSPRSSHTMFDEISQEEIHELTSS